MRNEGMRFVGFRPLRMGVGGLRIPVTEDSSPSEHGDYSSFTFGGSRTVSHTRSSGSFQPPVA